MFRDAQRVESTMMVPGGYIVKRVVSKPDWLKANGVEDIYAVSGCISKDFTDYIKLWKHNSYCSSTFQKSSSR